MNIRPGISGNLQRILLAVLLGVALGGVFWIFTSTFYIGLGVGISVGMIIIIRK